MTFLLMPWMRAVQRFSAITQKAYELSTGMPKPCVIQIIYFFAANHKTVFHDGFVTVRQTVDHEIIVQISVMVMPNPLDEPWKTCEELIPTITGQKIL